ncbi:MAG: patatin-like phospholipase family protein [Candidatus Saccharibacteria bacterium]
MDTNNKPKLGIALSGGSALGIFHIGFLKALTERQVKIDYISGTSAGAIVAAAFAFGVPLDELSRRAKKLSWYGLSKFTYSKLGLVSNQAIGDMIRELLGDPDIREAKIPLSVVATDISNGEKIVFKEGNLIRALMASSCIPGLFVPVEIDGRKLVDGGLTENLPLSPLKDMGADIRVGVDLFRFSPQRKPRNILDVIMNSIDILAGHQAHTYGVNSELMIEPHLEGFSPSDFKKSDELERAGYSYGSEAVPAIARLTGIEPPVRRSFWEKFVDWIENKA